MKHLTWKLILPLTVISFATFTKWWYVLPDDAPDTMFTGFPFPFVADGWHTSLSLQFFVTELILDFLIYFLFWFIVLFCINRFVIKIKQHKIVTIGLWTICGIILCLSGLIASNPNNLFYLKRDFDMEVMDTGYKFGWQHTDRPDYHKYHPEETKEQADAFAEAPIDKDNIKGNWYLNKWTMYRTLSFSDTTVFVDNHIDSVFTLNYSLSNDTLVLTHDYIPVEYKSKIIALTKDTLVIKGFSDEKGILMYSRTRRD